VRASRLRVEPEQLGIVVLATTRFRLRAGFEGRMPDGLAGGSVVVRLTSLSEGIRLRASVPAPPLPQASPKGHAAARPHLDSLADDQSTRWIGRRGCGRAGLQIDPSVSSTVPRPRPRDQVVAAYADASAVSLRQLLCFVVGHVPMQVVMARGGNAQFCACCGRCLTAEVRATGLVFRSDSFGSRGRQR
jgi:hypothetical protein